MRNLEDCLHLFVMSGHSDLRTKSPVIVVVHGDALLGGTMYQSYRSPAYLAELGFVTVSFQYRLGTFGFLAHPMLSAEAGTSGNYGLMDAIAALQWVQDNIEPFGGDPDNVTLVATGEGAALATALIGLPEAKGLFHRAILQSGTWMFRGMAPMQTLTEAERIGERQLAEFDDLSLEELRDLPPGRLVSFAEDGNPAGLSRWADTPPARMRRPELTTALPVWPVYTGDEELEVMEFGDRLGVESTWWLNREKIELFDRIFERLVLDAID